MWDKPQEPKTISAEPILPVTRTRPVLRSINTFVSWKREPEATELKEFLPMFRLICVFIINSVLFSRIRTRILHFTHIGWQNQRPGSVRWPEKPVERRHPRRGASVSDPHQRIWIQTRGQDWTSKFLPLHTFFYSYYTYAIFACSELVSLYHRIARKYGKYPRCVGEVLRIDCLINFLFFRSDWDVRRVESSPMSQSFQNQELNYNTSQSTECLDIDATATGEICGTDESNLSSSRNLHQCNCCQLDDSVTPNKSLKSREKMRKYQAVIRLNSINSCSDMSTLNLTNFDESRPELDLVLNVDGQPITTYYTIDSRRLASKHQKTQHDR